MTNTVPTDEQVRLADATAAGLRALAAMIEAAPQLDARCLGGIDVWYPDSAAELAKIARAARRAGATVTKTVSEKLYTLKVSWGGFTVNALAWRSQVCERVVVGVHEVTETVPDPEQLAKVPTVEVTKQVEQVEWVCRPLLAAAGDAVDGGDPS
jgi:hypothetical protein